MRGVRNVRGRPEWGWFESIALGVFLLPLVVLIVTEAVLAFHPKGPIGCDQRFTPGSLRDNAPVLTTGSESATPEPRP